ncbi:hypothetical protein [Pseudomonas sp. D1HM]|nr:hypothetical protein [Pseudomonas sp. D1HM]
MLEPPRLNYVAPEGEWQNAGWALAAMEPANTLKEMSDDGI